MSHAVTVFLFTVGLFFGMLLFLEIGRRIGIRRMKEDGGTAGEGVGAVDGAVFALLGLLIAFTFSGASARFDTRRQLIVEETNDIGTAYLRLDLLAADAQAALRESFRRYLDARVLLCAGHGGGCVRHPRYRVPTTGFDSSRRLRSSFGRPAREHESRYSKSRAEINNFLVR